MLDAFVQGAFLVFQWPALGYLLLGILIGIWLGAVPGLGGGLGIVLVLPFTFGMEPVSAFAILLAIYAVTSTSDTIASVMLGIPGTASSQATILDGYPMAQKGQASRAFGAAFTVSAFGGVFGAAILALSLPVALPIIVRFNNPELFMLAILGLAMVGSLSGRSVSKGLAAAALGLLFSAVGYADDQAIPRYWLGTTYLLDRLPLLPVVLGLFAVPELMELAIRDRSISRVRQDLGGLQQLMQGVRDAYRNSWLAARCAVIGVYIGMIPGLGGAIVDWVAYGHAVQSTKNPERYGTGDVRGVIAPEAANNAVRGGALIPTVAFGVPGSAMNALLLSALLIQGLRPGVEMLTTELPLTFSMVWTIAIANIIAAGGLMLWSNQVARVAFMSGHLIVPGVLLFVFMGAWLASASLGDWVALVVFGIIGYLMKQGGWPRPPVVLAFILGGLMENSFLLSWRIHEGVGWLTRPIVLVILVLIIATLFFSVRGSIARARLRETAAGDAADDTPAVTGEGEADNVVMSLAFGAIVVVVFLLSGIRAFAWPQFVALFPLIAIVPGLLLAVTSVGSDLMALRAARRLGQLRQLVHDKVAEALLGRSAWFIAYLVGTVVLTAMVGQKLAIPILMFVYLRVWGRFSVWLSAAYAAAGWLLLVGFYDRVVNTFWLRSMIYEPLREGLPGWFPAWLVI